VKTRPRLRIHSMTLCGNGSIDCRM